MRYVIWLLYVCFPSLALACPGCIAANEENRNAFLFTTALLTLIPLIIIGFTVRWLQARAKEREQSNPLETAVKDAYRRPSP